MKLPKIIMWDESGLEDYYIQQEPRHLRLLVRRETNEPSIPELPVETIATSMLPLSRVAKRPMVNS